MSANASIKFSGSTTGAGGDGRALIGIQGETVTVANSDDTDVEQWQFEILYVPPTSALTRGVKQVYSTDPNWTFVPDSSESFLIRLRVKDADGNESVDDRVFSVLEATGRLISPFKGSARSMNYGGQTDGWWPYHRAYQKAVDYLSRVVPLLRWQKVAADAAAATATAETPLGSIQVATTLSAIKITPLAALTANDTDKATILIQKRTGAGAATTVATLVTNLAGGSWVAFVPKAIPISAGAVLAGDVLTLSITKGGAGVIVPISSIEAFGAAT